MVGLSLFRPGPIKEIDNFVQAKNNKKFAPKSLDGQVIKGAEILEPVLKETRGIIVYQEQIMEIVSIWAGYSEIEADLFRDIVSEQKKHLDRKSTRLNSSHVAISYAVFCLKKKITNYNY